GEIEGVSAGVVFGWLPTTSGKSPRVEFRLDGKAVGSALATLARPDIVENKIAPSAAGFRFDLSSHFVAGRNHAVAVIDAASGKEISGSPFLLAERPGWGVLDASGGIELGGWVVQTDAAAPAATVQVEIDGEVVAEVAADRMRTDLRAIGVQDIRCGFSCVVPP